MELAIPILALGGLYFSFKEDKQNKNEGFQTNEELPNTDIPDVNYPEDKIFENSELEQTARLSTINQYDTPSVYTDKYFNKPLYPESSGTKTFTSMTGNQVDAQYFNHNNMTPFFGSKQRSQILDSESCEGILDSFSGAGTQFINKSEQSPLFSPGENYHHAFGAPNENDFYQSRVNPSSRMANVKPFETQNVGPGLGLGNSNEGSGGYNSGMALRESWMPKNVDEMRTINNKRSSGISLLGHEGAAASYIQSAPTTSDIGRLEKNRVERTWDMGHGERYFTTTGVEKRPTLHAIPIDRNVNRPETTTSYSGIAGSKLPETYTKGEYMESKHMDLGTVPLGVASITGKQSGTEHDYEIKAKQAYPNNRSSVPTDTNETYFGALGSAIGAVVSPLLDELRPSRKENVLGTLRPYQNASTGISNSYLFNPADRAPPTIRETTENNKYTAGINKNQNGGAYMTTDHNAPKQQRDTTSTTYVGSVGASSGTKEIRPVDAEYRQRNNDIKSSTIKGYMVQGNLSLNNNQINMRNRTGEIKNGRPLVHTSAPQSYIGADNLGLQHSKQQYNSNIQIDRNTPEILDAFRNNPYTHPIPK